MKPFITVLVLVLALFVVNNVAATSLTGCGTLSIPSGFYTLVNDIDAGGAACFVIAVDNVSLNCAGQTISNSAAAVGITPSIDGVTVKNCIFRNDTVGISTGGTTYNLTIQDNVFNDTYATTNINLGTSATGADINSNSFFTTGAANGTAIAIAYVSSGTTFVTSNIFTNKTLNINHTGGSATTHIIRNNVVTGGEFLFAGPGCPTVRMSGNFLNASNYFTNFACPLSLNETNGNYWADPYGFGFSQSCVDVNNDNVCDGSFTAYAGAVDYKPLKSYTNYGVPSTAAPVITASFLGVDQSQTDFVFQVTETSGAATQGFWAVDVVPHGYYQNLYSSWKNYFSTQADVCNPIIATPSWMNPNQNRTCTMKTSYIVNPFCLNLFSFLAGCLPIIVYNEPNCEATMTTSDTTINTSSYVCIGGSIKGYGPEVSPFPENSGPGIYANNYNVYFSRYSPLVGFGNDGVLVSNWSYDTGNGSRVNNGYVFGKIPSSFMNGNVITYHEDTWLHPYDQVNDSSNYIHDFSLGLYGYGPFDQWAPVGTNNYAIIDRLIFSIHSPFWPNLSTSYINIEDFNGVILSTEVWNTTNTYSVNAAIDFVTQTVVWSITDETGAIVYNGTRGFTDTGANNFNEVRWDEQHGIEMVRYVDDYSVTITNNTAVLPPYSFFSSLSPGVSQSLAEMSPILSVAFGSYDAFFYATDTAHGNTFYGSGYNLTFTYSLQTPVITNAQLANIIQNNGTFVPGTGGAFGSGFVSGDIATDYLPQAYQLVGIRTAASRFLLGLVIIIILTLMVSQAGSVAIIIVDSVAAVIFALPQIGLFPTWFLIVYVIIAAALGATALRKTGTGGG